MPALEDDGGGFDGSADHTLPKNNVFRETQAVLLDRPEEETQVGTARREVDATYRVVAS